MREKARKKERRETNRHACTQTDRKTGTAKHTLITTLTIHIYKEEIKMNIATLPPPAFYLIQYTPHSSPTTRLVKKPLSSDPFPLVEVCIDNITPEVCIDNITPDSLFAQKGLV